MKIDKVIFSSSEEYSDFWNIQSQVFAEGLGIEPVCLLWGKKKNTDMHEKYGKIREMSFIPYLPKIIQITWSKFHYVREEPETTWLIGDIDQIPLQRDWFIKQIKDCDDDMYLHLNASGCGQPYNLPKDRWETHGGTAMTEGGIDLPGHYHVALGETFANAYDPAMSFEEQVSRIVSSQRFGGGAATPCGLPGRENYTTRHPFEEEFYWIAEEMYSSEKLWVARDKGDIKFKGFYYDNKTERVDRGFWSEDLNDYRYNHENLKKGKIIDIHCMRPFEKYKDQTLRVVYSSGIIGEACEDR
jgi:hypothetical protein